MGESRVRDVSGRKRKIGNDRTPRTPDPVDGPAMVCDLGRIVSTAMFLLRKRLSDHSEG